MTDRNPMRFDPDARRDHGRSVRRRAPRSSHAGWTPPHDRPDPVGLLTEQEAVRVADLIPLRHERMLASPFAFYRGAAVLMAADLAGRPHTDLQVQLCGDAHIANFGGFLSPDRSIVFDMNDFDETHHGPFEWDVHRLATSLVLAGEHIGLDREAALAVARRSARSYREAMGGFATMSNLEVWYARADVDRAIADRRDEVSQRSWDRAQRRIAKARGKSSLRAFARLTEIVDGEPRIVSDPPTLVPARDVLGTSDRSTALEWIAEKMRTYPRSLQSDRRHLLEQYRFVDAARKVVGVGSVGTRCWIVLMLGRDHGDPLFLQVKEARASVLERHTGNSEFGQHGQRVVEGQRFLQAASDILLGWFRTETLSGDETDFYVRQLWDGKLTVDLDRIEPPALGVFADMAGWTLARGHARSGDRIAIASYLGRSERFDDAVCAFAGDYVAQNAADYAAARRAWEDTP